MSRICPIIFGQRYFWWSKNHHKLISHQQSARILLWKTLWTQAMHWSSFVRLRSKKYTFCHIIIFPKIIRAWELHSSLLLFSRLHQRHSSMRKTFSLLLASTNRTRCKTPKKGKRKTHVHRKYLLGLSCYIWRFDSCSSCCKCFFQPWDFPASFYDLYSKVRQSSQMET